MTQIEIAKNMRSLRKERGLTIKKVADAIGVEPSTYCAYEKGRRKPKCETLKKIAAFLSVSVAYLIGETDDRGELHRQREELMQEQIREMREHEEFCKIAKRKVNELTHRAEVAEMALKTASLMLAVNRQEESVSLQKATEIFVDLIEKAEKEIAAGEQKPSYFKATANEIIEKLLGYLGSNQKFVIVNDNRTTWVDCEKLFAYIEETAKEYGLEVVE